MIAWPGASQESCSLKTIAAVTMKRGVWPIKNAHMSEMLGAIGP